MLYVELRCERAFSESYMAVSLVDVTKFACESLEFSRHLHVISNAASLVDVSTKFACEALEF